jgi:citrate synthase
MGHAVYSLSDPRSDILKECAKALSKEKGREEEYALYGAVAKLAPEMIAEKRKMYKGVSANVDFYSGLIYKMLNIPNELYTPLFAISRIAGWSAHRIEEIQNAGKIIRPAYINVLEDKEYFPLNER